VEIKEKTKLFILYKTACNSDLKILLPLQPSNSKAEHCPGYNWTHNFQDKHKTVFTKDIATIPKPCSYWKY